MLNVRNCRQSLIHMCTSWEHFFICLCSYIGLEKLLFYNEIRERRWHYFNVECQGWSFTQTAFVFSCLPYLISQGWFLLVPLEKCIREGKIASLWPDKPTSNLSIRSCRLAPLVVQFHPLSPSRYHVDKIRIWKNCKQRILYSVVVPSIHEEEVYIV